MFVNNHETIIQQFIADALTEDVREGDFSSLAAIPKDIKGKAVLKIKDNGVLAGVELAKHFFNYVDPNYNIKIYKNDGDRVVNGDIAFEVVCNARSILKVERLVLNCMQRMSGVATVTSQYVNEVKHTSAKVLDTRKTTPLFRYFEKWGVRIGGGTNHRFGLYDMIMLKDNHIDYCGGIEKAILKADAYRKENKLSVKIEVETRNLEEVKEAISTSKVDRIMLDNYNLTDLKDAIDFIANRVETEASGGVTLQTIKNIAETGVNFISVGALTHHYVSLDLSLKAQF